MKFLSKEWPVVATVVLIALVSLSSIDVARVWAHSPEVGDDKHPIEGLIIAPDIVTADNLAGWRKEGFNSIVLVLDERFEAGMYQRAARAVVADKSDLYYWIEVGRNPAFAQEHPEWMASLGSHNDWRKQFPDLRKLHEGEVAKAWPWTPIGYQKAFDAHLIRIKALLQRVPADYRGLLLNDLQGGPSSCGCGNRQCRWAIDYGVPATTEKIAGHDVASKFVVEVAKLTPAKDVIPVWTTECEQEDMALEKQANRDWTTGYCGRVDCFNYCLDRFGEQWTALQATHHGPTGLLLLHKELLRDRTEYGDVANWITHAVEYLNLKKGNTIPPEKLWLVVQGYDVTSQDEKVARRAALKIGAGAVLVARTRIDQSYEPHLMPVKGK